MKALEMLRYIELLKSVAARLVELGDTAEELLDESLWNPQHPLLDLPDTRALLLLTKRVSLVGEELRREAGISLLALECTIARREGKC